MTSSSNNSTTTIQNNSYLTLHYKIQFTNSQGDSTVFADTFVGNPATLQIGVGQWAPAMEQPLLGLSEGDQHTYTVAADAAYGNHNPSLVQSLSKDLLLQNHNDVESLEPGQIIEFAPAENQRYSGLIKSISNDTVVVDFNHPLAGQTLDIEVYILGVM